MTIGAAISSTLPTTAGGRPVFCEMAFWIGAIWLPKRVLSMDEPPAAAVLPRKPLILSRGLLPPACESIFVSTSAPPGFDAVVAMEPMIIGRPILRADLTAFPSPPTDLLIMAR